MQPTRKDTSYTRSQESSQVCPSKWVEKEKEEEKKEKRLDKGKKSLRGHKKKERLIEKKESLARNEEDLNEQETKARTDLKAADELLNDATSKLDAALASTPLNKQSVTVAKMMLDTAKSKCQQAMDLLDSIREKQKPLDRTTHKLLHKTLPSTEMPEKKRKNESQGKQSGKILKTKHREESKLYLWKV